MTITVDWDVKPQTKQSKTSSPRPLGRFYRNWSWMFLYVVLLATTNLVPFFNKYGHLQPSLVLLSITSPLILLVIFIQKLVLNVFLVMHLRCCYQSVIKYCRKVSIKTIAGCPRLYTVTTLLLHLYLDHSADFTKHVWDYTRMDIVVHLGFC